MLVKCIKKWLSCYNNRGKVITPKVGETFDLEERAALHLIRAYGDHYELAGSDGQLTQEINNLVEENKNLKADNNLLIEKLAELDEEAAAEFKASAEADAEDDEDVVSLDEMTVKQLKAYAEEKGIDLGNAKNKGQILEAINAAEADDGNE